jgi:hypothetical protein
MINLGCLSVLAVYIICCWNARGWLGCLGAYGMGFYFLERHLRRQRVRSAFTYPFILLFNIDEFSSFSKDMIYEEEEPCDAFDQFPLKHEAIINVRGDLGTIKQCNPANLQ